MPRVGDKQLLVPFRRTASQTFDNLFAGANAETVAALRRFIKAGAGDPQRLLFLAGPPGCGKTHLLVAASAAVRGAVYLDQGAADAEGDVGGGAPGAHDAALACLDHLDVAAGERVAEERLFALIERLGARGVRVLAAARARPCDLGFLMPDLVTRLSAGMGRRLAAFNDDDKVSAIRQHAQRRGFTLSDAVMRYIMRRLARDMPSLFALLDRLDYWSMVRQSPVTVPLLRELERIDPQHFAPGGGPQRDWMTELRKQTSKRSE